MNNQSVVHAKTIDNILSRKGLQKLEEQIALPNLQLKFGKASDNGDCFFDSLVQFLNQLHDSDEYTIKALRTICHTFYLNNKELVDNWNQKDSTNPLQEDEYYFIQYTQSELAKYFNNRPPIWGRPAIEGVILCLELDLPGICVLEILWDEENNQPATGYYLAAKNSYQQIDAEKEIGKIFKDNTIPKLAVGQKSLHFVPILSKSISVQASGEKMELSQDASQQAAWRLIKTSESISKRSNIQPKVDRQKPQPNKTGFLV